MSAPFPMLRGADTYPPSAEREYASGLLQFIESSPSPYHAVATAAARLDRAGFGKIDEAVPWRGVVRPGGCYYMTRNRTTLIAVAVGARCTRATARFMVVGAHTDSPCPILKLGTTLTSSGYGTVKVSPYGGGLWTTWFDRDLTVAGQVIVRTAKTGGGRGLQPHQVTLTRPVLRIPMLAPHLDRDLTKSVTINLQHNFMPVLSTGPPAHILGIVGQSIGVSGPDIVSYDLRLADTQPPAFGGAHGEFMFAPRQDNLGSCFCALEALADSLQDQAALAKRHYDACAVSAAPLSSETGIRVVVLYDHEEVGSGSAGGARSVLLLETLRRVYACLPDAGSGADAGAGDDTDGFAAVLRRSFLVSADAAHAVHPNYPQKHDASYAPVLNGGPIIKHNVNHRYATSMETSSLLRELARRAAVTLQDFAVRSDMGCGSTIGPISAAQTAMRTVDIGCPLLSMHSVREMGGTQDVWPMARLLWMFFCQFGGVDDTFSMDAAPGSGESG